jgi:DnaK suppressor protein
VVWSRLRRAEMDDNMARAHKSTQKAGSTDVGSSSGGRDTAFLEEARALLLTEREIYARQADELKAQADLLALEHEPGDVQFDEEGGEGGTSNVDRELDLVLSGQARATVEEIDRALLKIDAGTYGRCERCGTEILRARLEALPHAALCVACKSGGLSSRR